MITKIETDGFKTFHDFALVLSPLQVIVGANGAGKSNLFDAILLLARLADADLRSAFQALRGEAGELFTIHADGTRADRMTLAVELLVEPAVEDSWGARAELRYTRLRYELQIVRQADAHGLERLYVARESLTPIPRSDDSWLDAQQIRDLTHWLPRLTGGRAPFISTTVEHDRPTVALHQDGRSGRKSSVAERMERTVLSGVSNTEFPHAFAAREEMRAWRLLQLNPAVLREPASMVGAQHLDHDGRNLPGVLARLKATNPYLLNDIARDMANLVPGFNQLSVETDRVRDEYVIWVTMHDGRKFSSRVLSDGTLRLLALTALKHDDAHRGVLLFEEPENGVHPQRLDNIARLVADLATDFSDPAQQQMPLRQFLCNTHSPAFIRRPPIAAHIVFALMATHSDPQTGRSERLTRMAPVRSAAQPALAMLSSAEERSYYAAEVVAFLEAVDPGEAHAMPAHDIHTQANGA